MSSIGLAEMRWCRVVFLLLNMSLASSLEGDNCLYCDLVRPEVLPQDEADQHEEAPLVCETQVPNASYKRGYPIELSDSFLKENASQLATGITRVCVQGGVIDGDKLIVPDRNAVVMDEPNTDQRRLAASSIRIGTKTLLAVRVTSSIGEAPVETVDAIESAIFGTGENPEGIPDDASVVAQYEAISHGKLLFTPASGSSNIQNGVANVEIDHRFFGRDVQFGLVPQILAQTEAVVGPLSNIDRIIFCLPNGSRFQGSTSWTAYTYLFHQVSHAGCCLSFGCCIKWKNYMHYSPCSVSSPVLSFRTFNGQDAPSFRS